MSTAAQGPSAGDVVTARPWISGYETAARKGIVLGADGDYLIVWFRGLGGLCRDEAGHAIQAILPRKAKVAGNVAQYSDRALITLAKAVRDYDSRDAAGLYGALYAIARSRSLA